MALVQIISDTITWDGRSYFTDILQKVTVSKLTYWYISVDGEKYWVVRRMLKDLRPIISNRLKKYLGLNCLDIITTKHNGKLHLLTRSYDPSVYPETTLTTFFRQGLITEDLQDQVRRIYAFRALSGMTANIDSSIIVRVYGTIIKAYSFVDTFAESHKDSIISEAIFNRWFDDKTSEYVILADIIADIIGAPRLNASEDVGEKGTYIEAVDLFSEHIEEVISEVDSNLLWYRNDVVNYLIGKVTP